MPNIKLCLAYRKASSSESVRQSADSVQSDKSQTSDEFELLRPNSTHAESVNGQESLFEPVPEPTIQEDVSDLAFIYETGC